MNHLCECATPGLCTRHGVTKNAREHKLCMGVDCSPEQCAKYWNGWEKGEQRGQTAPVAEPQLLKAREISTSNSDGTLPASSVSVGCGSCGGKAASGTPKPVRLEFGPGSDLMEAYHKKGLTACQACIDLKYRMNAWGVDGCEERIEDIVNDIFPRAKIWLAEKRPWIHAMLPGVAEDFGIRLKLRADVSAAIGVAREKAKNREQAIRSRQSGFGPFRYTAGPLPEFVTTARLMKDIEILASKIPPNTSRIVGVSRSGLCSATMLSMLLHLPLEIVRQSSNDLVPAGNGWRLTGNTGGTGPVIVVDDTVMTGNSFRHVLPIVRRKYPNAVAAAVYVNPAATRKPDMWARDLPWPHLLEWNLFNSVLSPHCAVDCDGILCRDCSVEQDDDGERYMKFLTDAIPLYMVRKTRIPMIVTARLEKYREVTMQWLKRHGMAVDELVMGHWKTLRDRNQDDVAAYKAKHFKRFLQRRHALQPPMFIESDARQASRIAHLSGGLVVCPAAGRCF